jgi:amidase
VPIAHANDGGGSIRIPAAFCGLIGLKATRGRLARMASSKRMPVKIATYGLLSRTVRDTAAFFAAVDDGSDTLPAIGKVEGPSQARLRVGKFVDGPFGHDVDPAVREAVESTARRLEGAGHTVIDIEPPYTESLADDFLLHWGFMAAGVVMTMRLSKSTDASKLEPWTRGLARFMAKRWWKVPAAIVRLRRFGDQYAKVFEGCDVILSPTTGAPAPPIGHLSPGLEFEAKLERIYRLLPYTPVQNASGGPAISLPVARTSDGLPVGIQLAGPSGEERRLLELAFELEDGLVGPVPVD